MDPFHSTKYSHTTPNISYGPPKGERGNTLTGGGGATLHLCWVNEARKHPNLKPTCFTPR